MPAPTKYDRESLRLKFLTSSSKGVLSFLIEEGIVKQHKDSKKKIQLNGAMTAATTWRSDERKEFRQRVYEEAKKEAEKKMADEMYKVDLKEMWDIKKRSINIVKLALNEMTVLKKDKDWNTRPVLNRDAIRISKEVRNFWEMAKIELKEPTKYIEDLSEPKPVELTQEQKDIANDFKKILLWKIKPKK